MSLELEQIFYYPLTGAQGVELTSANVGPAGIDGDRAYILYDDEYKRVSSKQVHNLLQCRIEQAGGYMFAAFPGELPIAILPTEYETPITIDEFGDQTPCLDMGDTVAQEFSEILGRPVRLAYKTAEWRQGGGIAPEKRVAAPLHIVAQETVNKVGAMVGSDAIDARRFRPNIVISGVSQAEIEQEWPGKVVLRIGRVALQVHRGTQRCAVTGLDPQTGENLRDAPKAFPLLRKATWNNREKAAVGVYAYPRVHRDLQINLSDTITLHNL